MYKRLNKNRTKKYYREIVKMVTKETLELKKMSPNITMYLSIYNQLIDIQDKIIVKSIVFSEQELYNRYTLGAVAVKNFDLDKDEYAQKLSDSFGGTFDYCKMPEE